MSIDAPLLDLDAVESAIAGTEFSGYLMHFPTLPSTSDLALEAAHAGARHGVWIADEQTAGRGRGDHRWHSAPGDGLYLSALVTPAVPVQSALELSLRTALAVQAAIASSFGFRVREEIDIRWPNDLLLHGRKCGGILIETAVHPAPPTGLAMLRYAVIGIGLNLNHTAFPLELEWLATSIRRELPQPAAPLPREPLLAALLRALDDEVRLLLCPGPPGRELDAFSTWFRGKRVRVGEEGGYTGTTAGLTPDGFLLVQADDGTRRTVHSGGVRSL